MAVQCRHASNGPATPDQPQWSNDGMPALDQHLVFIAGPLMFSYAGAPLACLRVRGPMAAFTQRAHWAGSPI